MDKKDKCIDTGIDSELIEHAQSNNESVKQYSDSHRRFIKKAHKLGFESKLKAPCSSCGHRICRCADRRAREDRGKTVTLGKWND